MAQTDPKEKWRKEDFHAQNIRVDGDNYDDRRLDCCFRFGRRIIRCPRSPNAVSGADEACA